MSVPAPAISICIPVRNGVKWVDAAIDSALGQTRADVEVVVVENASTDGTRAVVERRLADDSRLRLEPFDEAVNAPANHNRAVDLARGEFVKFLHADDVLFPTAVQRMAAILETHPEVGFVFGRRKVVLSDPDDPAGIEWRRTFGTLHDRFRPLEEVNHGTDLLDQYLPALGDPAYRNWIAEPSAVMVRRECFDRVGRFTERMRQSWDLELWLRIFARYDVGFVDEEVAAFRFHSASLTAANARVEADWLDLLWLYEGLLAEPALGRHQAMIRDFRRRQLARTARKQAGRLRHGDLDVRPLAGYLRHRIAG